MSSLYLSFLHETKKKKNCCCKCLLYQCSFGFAVLFFILNFWIKKLLCHLISSLQMCWLNITPLTRSGRIISVWFLLLKTVTLAVDKAADTRSAALYKTQGWRWESGAAGGLFSLFLSLKMCVVPWGWFQDSLHPSIQDQRATFSPSILCYFHRITE